MGEQLLYKHLQQELKKKIYAGELTDGDLLPSENELTQMYKVTRTTVRKALDELVKERIIRKEKGKGSVVTRDNKNLGLLGVKGFSQVVTAQNKKVSTKIIEAPAMSAWPEMFFYPLSETEEKSGCISMKRLRLVENDIVMLENTYIPNFGMSKLCETPFVNGSLFETLHEVFHLNILRVEQDMRAIIAQGETATLLKVYEGHPLLNIYLKFYTDKKNICIYSNLLCNTTKYSISS